MPEVDVIVITRGGGSVEDLLPFSDRTTRPRGRLQRRHLSSVQLVTSRMPLCSITSPTFEHQRPPTRPCESCRTSKNNSNSFVACVTEVCERSVSRLDRELKVRFNGGLLHPGLADPSAPDSHRIAADRDSRFASQKSLAHHLQLASERL